MNSSMVNALASVVRGEPDKRLSLLRNLMFFLQIIHARCFCFVPGHAEKDDLMGGRHVFVKADESSGWEPISLQGPFGHQR